MTTQQDKDARPAPDLVDRNFTATGPNQLWVAEQGHEAGLGFEYTPGIGRNQ